MATLHLTTIYLDNDEAGGEVIVGLFGSETAGRQAAKALLDRIAPYYKELSDFIDRNIEPADLDAYYKAQRELQDDLASRMDADLGPPLKDLGAGDLRSTAWRNWLGAYEYGEDSVKVYEIEVRT